jgi:hypothetical protein
MEDLGAAPVAVLAGPVEVLAFLLASRHQQGTQPQRLRAGKGGPVGLVKLVFFSDYVAFYCHSIMLVWSKKLICFYRFQHSIEHAKKFVSRGSTELKDARFSMSQRFHQINQQKFTTFSISK